MRRRWRAWRALSPPDRRLFLRAWFLLLEVDLALRAVPFRRLERWSRGRGRSSRGHGEDPHAALGAGSATERHGEPGEGRGEWEGGEAGEVVKRVLSLVERAGRNHFPWVSCLRRALVLRRLLAEAGIETELRIGVNREGGRLGAHAWLEWEGRPVGGPEDVGARFAALPAWE